MQAHENATRPIRPAMKSARPAPEASVVSISKKYLMTGHGGSATELSARIGSILEEVARVVRDGGGFVGHIKAFAATPDGASLGLSVVRDKVRLQGPGFAPKEPMTEFKLAVTAIVYGCPKDELNRLMELGLAIGLPRSFCSPVVFKKPAPLALKMLRPAPTAGAA